MIQSRTDGTDDPLAHELGRQRRLAALVIEFADRLQAAGGGGAGRAEALVAVTIILRAHFAVDECAVSRADASAGSLTVVAVSDGRSARRPVPAQVRMPWTVARMRRGRRIVFADPSELPEQAADLRRWALSAGVLAHVTTPMLAAGALVGGLHLSSIGVSRRWSAAEFRELDALAALLAPALVAAPPPVTRPGATSAPTERLEDVERAHILAVLERTNWRINGSGNAAERLDLHPNTLRSRLKKLGVNRPTPRRR